MVTFTSPYGHIDLPDCNLYETETIGLGIQLAHLPDGTVRYRKRLTKRDNTKAFKISTICEDKMKELLTFLQDNMGEKLDIAFSPSTSPPNLPDPPLGTFTGVLLQSPLQILQANDDRYEVEFKCIT